jgi:hypothetical protein
MHEYYLSPKQMLAASQIAVGDSHKQAAKIAKVSAQTISEWMQHPAFIAKINEIQLNTLNESQNRFRSLASNAVAVLEGIMAESTSERLKMDAAKFILETIRIAPYKDFGLWMVGPTTAEEIESNEHVKAVQKRMKEIDLMANMYRE